MRHFWAFAIGGLFGAGLYVSGMTDTRKVQGWLDFFGDWDPTLAFVIGGAIAAMAVAWQISERRKSPVLGGNFPAQADPNLNTRLIAGSVLFGVGWGLSGLCPGPSLASLTWGGTEGLIFLLAMIAGMWAEVPTRAKTLTAA